MVNVRLCFHENASVHCASLVSLRMLAPVFHSLKWSLHLTVSSVCQYFAYLYFSLSYTHTFSLLPLSLSVFLSSLLRYQSYFSLAGQGHDWQRGEVIEFLSQSDSHQHRQFRHSQARRNRQGGHRVDLEPQLTTGGHRRLKPEEETGGNKCDGTLQFYSPCIHGSKTDMSLEQLLLK